MKHSKRYLAKRAFYGLERIISNSIWPYCLLKQRLFSNRSARILAYHSVANFPKEKEIPYDNVPPALFELHMNILEKECYNVISLRELVALLREKKEVPFKTLAITFDDGYKNNYVNALPILEKRGLKATFFVIAEGINQDQPLPHLLWDDPARKYHAKNPLARLPMKAKEIRTLFQMGHEIGSHGLTHRSIGNLNVEQAQLEIFRSKEVLESLIHGEVQLFAYPFGAASYGDYNSKTQYLLQEAGYQAACTTEIGSIRSKPNLYELPRIPVRETDNHHRFKQKLQGGFDWVGPFKKIFQSNVPRIDKTI